MRRENIVTSGGYYVAIPILAVWKRLAHLAPDQPHGWSFPDATHNVWKINGLDQTGTSPFLSKLLPYSPTGSQNLSRITRELHPAVYLIISKYKQRQRYRR